MGTVIKETSYRTHLTRIFPAIYEHTHFFQSRDICALREWDEEKKSKTKGNVARKSEIRGARGKTANRATIIPAMRFFSDRETIVSRRRRRRVYAALSTPRSREIPHFGSALRFIRGVYAMQETALGARAVARNCTRMHVSYTAPSGDKTRIICGRRMVLNYRGTIRTAAHRYRWPRGNSRIDFCRGADYGLTVQSSLWVSGFAKRPAELANESNWMSGKGFRTRRAIATVESDGKRRTRARKMITIDVEQQ